MKSVNVVREIKAPVEVVFQTIADMNEYSQAVPQVTEVEFLSEQTVGVGARFRETRTMNGKPVQGEFEVTEFEDNHHLRIVTDSGGAVWDSLFSVQPHQDGTQLTLQMDVREKTLFAKIMNWLIQSMIISGVEKDMDAVKEYCEKPA